MSRVKTRKQNATVRSLEQFSTKLSRFRGWSIAMIGIEEVFVRTTCSEIALRDGIIPKLGLQHMQAGRVIVMKDRIKNMNRIVDENIAMRLLRNTQTESQNPEISSFRWFLVPKSHILPVNLSKFKVSKRHKSISQQSRYNVHYR